MIPKLPLYVATVLLHYQSSGHIDGETQRFLIAAVSHTAAKRKIEALISGAHKILSLREIQETETIWDAIA